MKKIFIKIEKITIRLAKKGFLHIFFSSIICKLISFFSGLIIVRLLNKREFGVFSYAQNIYNFVFVFNGLGLTQSVLQIISEGGSEGKKIKVFNYCGSIGTCISFLLTIIIVFIGVFMKLPIKGANTILLYMSLIPVLEFVYEIKQMKIRAEKNNKEYAFNNICYSIITIIITTALSYKFRLLGRVVALYLSLLFIIVVQKYHSKISINPSFKINESERKDIFKIGIISMINNGLSSLLYLIDIFTIGALLKSDMAVATYKVATVVPTALMFIPTSIVIFIYPYFCEHKDDTKWLLDKFKAVIFLLGIFNVLIGLLLNICAPFIIQIFFGEEYMDGLIPFRILILNYVISGTFRIITGNLLITQRKLFVNTISSVISAPLNIIFNYVLINKYGLVGASIATLSIVVIECMFCTIMLIISFKKKNS